METGGGGGSETGSVMEEGNQTPRTSIDASLTPGSGIKR